MIQEIQSRPCTLEDDHTILYLFFKEKNQMFLLLGREESNDDIDESDSSSFNDTEITYDYIDHSQNDEVQEDIDNDSPYFVKITLESKLLNKLNDSTISESHEIEGRYQQLIGNEIFN